MERCAMVVRLGFLGNRRVAGALLAWVGLVFAVTLTGCTPQSLVRHIFGRNHVMEGMNTQVSINVLAPPWWWPDEDTFREKYNKLGDIQKQYLEEQGKPEYLRLLFNRQGTVLGYDAMSMRQGMPEPKGLAWIYIERNLEVTFETSGPVEKPLTDEVKTLCLLGDPDEIKPIGTDQTIRNVRYIYNREGVHIDFLDGKKTAERKVQPLPEWMRSTNM